MIAARGALVLQTGRPVLAVPPEATALSAAKVIVAWKDTREARRAIHDALPFLKRAAAVTLTEIVGGGDAIAASEARLADVAAHLARRGVRSQASVAIEAKGSPAAHQLWTSPSDKGRISSSPAPTATPGSSSGCSEVSPAHCWPRRPNLCCSATEPEALATAFPRRPRNAGAPGASIRMIEAG